MFSLKKAASPQDIDAEKERLYYMQNKEIYPFTSRSGALQSNESKAFMCKECYLKIDPTFKRAYTFQRISEMADLSLQSTRSLLQEVVVRPIS